MIGQLIAETTDRNFKEAVERVKSERRNPIVADVLARMNLMERRGTGLREICAATAAEDAYLPEHKPRFEDRGGSFWVTLYNMNRAADPVTDPVSPQVSALLEAIGGDSPSTSELMDKLGLSHRQTFRENYLRPALESGLVEHKIPDKPNSRLQKYRASGPRR